MRDTDLDWRRIAETDPYYGVSTSEDYRLANLDEEKKEQFYENGVREISLTIDILKQLYGDFAANCALDFGCGVGRLTIPMADHFEHVVGVDISPGMLDLAQERADKLKRSNVEFCSSPPDLSFDWINSFIVFQHIPPERGYLILSELLEKLGDGGLVSLHFFLFRNLEKLAHIELDWQFARWDGQHLDCLIPAPATPPGSMRLYDYDLTRIFAILTQNGITKMTLHHADHKWAHGARIFGRKSI